MNLIKFFFVFIIIFNFNQAESSNQTSITYESISATLASNSTSGLNFASSNNHSSSTPSSNFTDLNATGHLDFCFSTCDGKHQLCVDNVCQCHPQYTWNVNTSTCEYLTCNKSIECQTYDQNRFCKDGSCLCNENSRINYGNGLKCTATKCSNQYECWSYKQNCINGSCQCDFTSGFRMNEESGECQRFKCSNSTECQTYDSNRFCDITDGMCKCKDTFTVGSTNKCEPTFCYGQSITCQGKNQICSAEHCYCDENSTLSEITGKCERNSCQNSTDCESSDENSFCSDGICKCKDNYLKSHHRCIPQTCDLFSISWNFCTSNTSVCVDNLCECKPNTQYSDISGKCEPFSCKHSNECQRYDQNRYCSNGSCHCYDHLFVQDLENGYKCKPTSCQTKDDCSLNNTVCIDNQCSCAPDHFYNETTKNCEHYECLSSGQCYNPVVNPYDQRVCDSGKCVCSNGSNPDQSNGGKCIIESKSFHNFCNSDNNCDNGSGSEKCVNSMCQCAPNYKYNHDLKRCRKFVCNQTNDCTDYDSERVCTDGQCVCRPDFVENNQNGKLCIQKSATYGKYCLGYDCYEGNQRCVDSLCRCKPNYSWNSNTQKCEYFQCNTIQSNCWTTYDYYRHCDIFGGGCVCDTLYSQDASNGYKCKYDPPIIPTFTPITPSYTYHYTYYWYGTIPAIFIISLLSACYRVKRNANRVTRVTRVNRVNTTKIEVNTANASPPPPPYTP